MSPSLRDSSSSSPTSWVVTVGGTAVGLLGTAAWMSYTNKRFVPLFWSHLNSLTSRASSTSTKPKSYYLDYNGTTPIYEEVFDAMTPYLKEHFGNPSSSHLFGTAPRKAIENSRKQILTRLLNAPPSSDLSSIWFTGCGTESDNMAIRLALLSSSSASKRTKHIVTSNVEHPAIENYLRHLESSDSENTDTGDKSDHIKVTVTRVPVDTEGKVSAKEMIDAITPDTVLVTLMLANNESGALQPIKEVAEECRKRGILCHTDAAQAVSIFISRFHCANSSCTPVALIFLSS